MLKPRIRELGTIVEELGVKPLRATKRTLKERQQETGRTLALNGAAWRKLRASVLSEQPLCPECLRMGRHIAATDVDHIDNDPRNNERSNLVGLCHAHHSEKTARHEHYKRTGERLPVIGCDVNGMPLDPDHPWNKEKSPATDDGEPRVLPSFNANRENEP